ncbi:MAG: hypothetical protein K0Q93_3009, partial [Nocardioidaceae bacterium]|nr:hypothetical protein [Nocardioidaceae bacterium]
MTTVSVRPTGLRPVGGLSPASAYARALSGEECAVVGEDGTRDAL